MLVVPAGHARSVALDWVAAVRYAMVDEALAPRVRSKSLRHHEYRGTKRGVGFRRRAGLKQQIREELTGRTGKRYEKYDWRYY